MCTSVRATGSATCRPSVTWPRRTLVQIYRWIKSASTTYRGGIARICAFPAYGHEYSRGSRAEVAQNYSTIGRATIAHHSPSFCATICNRARVWTTVHDGRRSYCDVAASNLRWNGREEHDYSDDCQRLVDDGVRTYHEWSGDGCDRHSDQHDRSRDYHDWSGEPWTISTIAPATITIDLASNSRPISRCIRCHSRSSRPLSREPSCPLAREVAVGRAHSLERSSWARQPVVDLSTNHSRFTRPLLAHSGRAQDE